MCRHREAVCHAGQLTLPRGDSVSSTEQPSDVSDTVRRGRGVSVERGSADQPAVSEDVGDSSAQLPQFALRQDLDTRRPTAKVQVLCILIGSEIGKVFPYSLPSVGPGADPGVQAVSPQVT